MVVAIAVAIAMTFLFDIDVDAAVRGVLACVVLVVVSVAEQNLVSVSQFHMFHFNVSPSHPLLLLLLISCCCCCCCPPLTVT